MIKAIFISIHFDLILAQIEGKEAPITFSTNYRKASGKPLALAMGMNTVVALATLKKLVKEST